MVSLIVFLWIFFLLPSGILFFHVNNFLFLVEGKCVFHNQTFHDPHQIQQLIPYELMHVNKYHIIPTKMEWNGMSEETITYLDSFLLRI